MWSSLFSLSLVWRPVCGLPSLIPDSLGLPRLKELPNLKFLVKLLTTYVRHFVKGSLYDCGGHLDRVSIAASTHRVDVSNPSGSNSPNKMHTLTADEDETKTEGPPPRFRIPYLGNQVRGRTRNLRGQSRRTGARPRKPYMENTGT